MTRQDWLERWRLAACAFIALTLLFALLAGVQFLQFFAPSRALPPFDAWRGGMPAPYPLIAAAHVFVMAMAGALAWRMFAGTLAATWRLGNILLGAGGIYLAAACIDLIVRAMRGAPALPTCVHAVFAAMMVSAALYQLARAARVKSG